MIEPAWTTLDSLRAWELAVRLAREGHEELRRWFADPAHPASASEPVGSLDEVRP